MALQLINPQRSNLLSPLPHEIIYTQLPTNPYQEPLFSHSYSPQPTS